MEKIKFLFVFCITDITEQQGKAFKEHFLEFLDGFEKTVINFEDIFNATAVMMTKVPRNFDTDRVTEVFQAIPMPTNRRQRELIDSFKKNILKGKKIFFMHVPEEGKTANNQNNDLVDIFKKTSFWSRSLTPEK